MAKVTNPVEVSRPEFVALFDSKVHDALNRLIDKPQTRGIVCFENLDFCSSELGARSALAYGEAYTYKDLATTLDGHLGDMPSRFQYPVKYYVKPPI